MQFLDAYEQEDFEYVLKLCFNYVEAGTRTTGDFAGQKYDDFYWRETVDKDGFVMVWFERESETLRSHHTYRYPPDIYS